MKTCVILTPPNEGEAVRMQNELEGMLSSIDYEIVWVVDFEPNYPEFVRYVKVPKSIGMAARKNIGRQLASLDVKILMFIESLEELTKQALDFRVQALMQHPTIMVAGRQGGELTPEEENELFLKLTSYIHLSKDDFKEHCCMENGAFRHVTKEALTTTVKMWDSIGGLPITAQYPVLEYCGRVQSLRFHVAPNPV